MLLLINSVYGSSLKHAALETHFVRPTMLFGILK